MSSSGTILPVAPMLLLLLGLGGCAPSDSDPGTGESAVVPEPEVNRLVEEAMLRLQASDGGRLVLDAIEAHGGLENWYRAPTSSYTWEYTRTWVATSASGRSSWLTISRGRSTTIFS
jgi:hypothetical protein